MKWIKVSERLPKKDGHYLVYLNDNVALAEYDHTKENPFLYGGGAIRPTHWATIPKGPALDAVLRVDNIPVAGTSDWDNKWNDPNDPRKKTLIWKMK